MITTDNASSSLQDVLQELSSIPLPPLIHHLQQQSVKFKHPGDQFLESLTWSSTPAPIMETQPVLANVDNYNEGGNVNSNELAINHRESEFHLQNPQVFNLHHISREWGHHENI